MVCDAKTTLRRKVYAQVVRVQFETAFVSFSAEAGFEEQALKDLAVEHAIRLPETTWQPADSADGSQRPFAISVVTQGDRSSEVSPAPTRQMCDRFDSYRFLLLQADIENGEGEVVLQPWFNPPDLLIADVTKDWITALDDLAFADFHERFDEAVAGGPITPQGKLPADEALPLPLMTDGNPGDGNTSPEQPRVQQVYRQREAARLFGVSVSTWKRYVVAGIVPPPLRIGPGRVGWLHSDLVAVQQGWHHRQRRRAS